MLHDRIISGCILKEYITTEQIPWLRYNLERIITTILGAIPFFIFGTYLTSFIEVSIFYLSFSFIRRRTNGFHAQTKVGCIIASLMWEFIFFRFLYPFLNVNLAVYILILAGITIFALAPYRNTNIHFTDSEARLSAKCARIRFSIIAVGTLLCYFSKYDTIANSSTLGIAMAAFMLALAYLELGGKNDERIHKK